MHIFTASILLSFVLLVQGTESQDSSPLSEERIFIKYPIHVQKTTKQPTSTTTTTSTPIVTEPNLTTTTGLPDFCPIFPHLPICQNPVSTPPVYSPLPYPSLGALPFYGYGNPYGYSPYGYPAYGYPGYGYPSYGYAPGLYGGRNANSNEDYQQPLLIFLAPIYNYGGSASK